MSFWGRLAGNIRAGRDREGDGHGRSARSVELRRDRKLGVKDPGVIWKPVRIIAGKPRSAHYHRCSRQILKARKVCRATCGIKKDGCCRVAGKRRLEYMAAVIADQ